MKRIILLLALFVANASAANKYLRQGATGSGNGNDWTNAYTTIAALETGLARGDTGYVAAGAYTGQIFNTAASGTTLITVKKATVADHGIATGWSDSFATGQATFSGSLQFQSPYWLIDGVTGGGPGSWSSGHGFKATNTGDFPTIMLDNGNITIRHVETVGQFSAGPKGGTGNDAVQYRGNNGGGPIVMSHCWFHDAGRCIFYHGVNGSTWIVEYSHSSTHYSTGAQHSEVLADRSTAIFTFRWGMVTYETGTGGFIAANDTNGGQATVELYGNIFIDLGTLGAWGIENNGFISGFSSGVTMLNWKVYNNSFINFPSLFDAFGNSGASSGCLARNNLFYNVPSLNAGSFTTSFNHFINSPSTGTNVTTGSGNPFQSIDPINANFGKLVSNTAAGTPLAAPYNTDMYGNTRTSWTRGAVEFVTGGGGDTTPPSLLSSTINAAGTQLTVNLSESVQVGAGGSGGMALTAGGAVTLSFSSVSGSSVTYNTSRVIGQAETLTATYTQPSSGIEDLAGNDLASFSGQAVTNNSTQQQVNTPTFSVPSGSYYGAQSVILACSTPGAVIRYTTDGSTPTASSTQYTTPLPVSATASINAKAFLSGFIDSVMSSASYEIGTWVSGVAWKNIVVPQRTGNFTWLFRASASSATSGGMIGLAPNTSASLSDLAQIVRFGPTGTIQARNSAAWAAVNTFNYVAGTSYDFAFTINLAASTYSLTVAQISGSPVTIASNYTNNSTAIGITEVDNVGISVPTTGTVTVSQMSFGGVVTIPTLTGATIGAVGNTLTLGFSETVSYGVGGSGGWTMNASGGAVTLTPTANPTSFTTSRTIAAGETGTISYTQPGNGVESGSGGDLATLTGFAFSNQSSVDLTPPIPNPMTFSAIPSAQSSFSVTMTASVATDASTPPVQYYFDETSGNPGGADSGWTTQRTYTNSQLSPGIEYTYRVLARDSAAVPNQTTPSSSVNVTTPIIAGGKVITPARTTGAGFFNP